MRRCAWGLLPVMLILLGPRAKAASLPAAPEDPFRGFGDIIVRAASQTGVDAALIAAVIRQSSAFDPKARDASGGAGLMLMTPDMARSSGLGDPFDPAQNVAAGARLLASLLSRYSGDVSKAVAAFHAGPGLVDRYGGVPPGRETQDFVSRVLRYREEFARAGRDDGGAPDLGRWGGEWGDGAYRMTVSVSGDAWSGTFRAEFNDGDPKHKDTGGRMFNVRREGDAFVGEWESSYSDSEKSGRRWGTFKIRLEPGATRAEDRMTGDWVEKGDEMVKANPGTAMYPGRVWSVGWKRVS